MAKSPPSSPFYWNDYYRDTRVLQPASRGVWMDLLCKLHESGRRGEVTMPLASWLQWCGCPQDHFLAAIRDVALTEVGVVLCDGGDMSRDVPDGPLYVPNMVTVKNRRMVREKTTREYERLKKQNQRRPQSSPQSCPAAVPTCPAAPSSSFSSSPSDWEPPNPLVKGGGLSPDGECEGMGGGGSGLARMSDALKALFMPHLNPPGVPRMEGEGS